MIGREVTVRINPLVSPSYARGGRLMFKLSKRECYEAIMRLKATLLFALQNLFIGLICDLPE